MLENCLRHKIIRDFLKQYTEKRWKDIIPSLIQIGILNLQKSFNKIIFSLDELKMVLHHLQISQIEKDKERNKEKENNIKDITKDPRERIQRRSYSKDKEREKEKENIFKSYLKLNERSKSPESYSNINYNVNNKIMSWHNNTQKMKKIEVVTVNQDKIKSCNETINEDKYNIKNDFNYFKNNASIDFKNESNKQKNRNYKKINIERNKNKHLQRQLDKISYAISYDKDLRPESISKKINKINNTNINNIKTECNNFNAHSNFVESSKKKLNSKSKYNKINYLNLNLNNINRINIMKNIKRKHYNLEKSNLNSNMIQSYENQKNKFFKKINKGDKLLMNKNKDKKLFNNKVSNSYNRNINFINTLYQGMNTNGPTIKKINYFSNKKESEHLLENNKENHENLQIKNEIIIRKNNNKSGKPLLSKIFANITDKGPEAFNFKINKEKDIKNRIIKNNSYNRIKTLEQKSKYGSNDYFTKNTNNPKTPKNNNIENINNDFKPMSFSEKKTKNNIKIDNDINIVKINDNFGNNENNIENINNIDNNIDNKIDIVNNDKIEQQKEKENQNDILNSSKDKNEGLKGIKIIDMTKATNNNEAINFEKVNGKDGGCRYFNIFGHDGDEISLTHAEKDYSGMIDSSTSNEIQMNTDYFFKATPIKNVFKDNKSNNQSNISNSKFNNEI